MKYTYPQRRRIRLENEAYGAVGAICSVTVGVKARAKIFADYRVANAAVEVLKDRASRTGVPIYCYCIMPDHVHLVLEASPTCNIITFVAQFKNLAQRAAWRLGIQGAFWQKSFWDHFLRREEQVEIVVNYVLQNPVRSGIAKQWQDYSFCGSLVFDLAEDRETAGDKPPPYIERVPNHLSE